MFLFVFITAPAVLAGAYAATDEQSRVVRSPQGPVKGYKDPSGDFYAFYGIPYATAPTGPHKFKGPLPPPEWQDTFEAIDKTIVCPQSKMYVDMLKKEANSTITKECLIANVFVPDTEAINLPVVVYVHGGAFQLGFGNSILQKSLLSTGKIIIVNFNYRLGIHGFLCLGTEDAPGNAGMKDQVAALRWVKQNIASYGGNPNDVSLIGSSSGAAAVELLLVSKSTRGLFNKIIPESGAGVAVWAVQNDPLDIARSYARSKGFTEAEVDDVYALEDFFKHLSLDALQADPFLRERDSTFKFVPCIERKGTEDTFLTDAPANILKNGDYEKLPVLTGVTDMEGTFRIIFFEDWKHDMNDDFSDFLPADLRFADESEQKEVTNKIKEFYFGERIISADTAVSYVDYFSDVMFVYPTYRSLSLQRDAGSDSLYSYMYAYVDNKTYAPYPGVTGAKHCDQSMILGDITWRTETEPKFSNDYKKMKDLLTDVWTNFIVTGLPTPKGSLAEEVFGGEWLPMSPARSHYALFNTTSELKDALLTERMEFWDDIYSKYYRTPIPPPEPPKKPKSEL